MEALIKLAFAFAQVGICAFGGGLSTLPLIEYQLVTHTGWLTHEQFAQVLALSQVTPGPIAVNAATFVGYQQAGIPGAFISTFSLIAAPILALCAVLLLLRRASAENSRKFKSLLRPIVAGLLTMSLAAPLRSTAGNGAVAVGMFALGVALVRYCRFFRENPPAMLFLFGAAGVILLT